MDAKAACLNCTLPICDDRSAECRFIQILPGYGKPRVERKPKAVVIKVPEPESVKLERLAKNREFLVTRSRMTIGQRLRLRRAAREIL